MADSCMLSTYRYMWRFKSDMFGRPVHVGQTVTAIGGVQAQVQELGIKGTPTISGVISERTHFVFRSRSARIIWLVQISCEMWEYDKNGDLYFEKFLNQFADPLFDRWKVLSVTHSLTVVFFARTLYLDGVDPTLTPDLWCKASLQTRSDGVLYQDFFKVVLENSSEVDKVAHLRMLKKEFWAFPKNVGWNIERDQPYRTATGTYTPPSLSQEKKKRPIAVPSDAVTGNVLEAINTTLNLLDKHYIDRDLLRTGNSIVMISAGVGIFKVKPTVALITKQRMMDTGIGLDFISLSQPPLHHVPLFLLDCKEEGLGDFYVVPQWINVCYVDCRRDSSATVENATAIALKNTSNAASNSTSSSTSAVTSTSTSTSKNIEFPHHWTGLEEFGGVSSSRRNRDVEVEKIYHNINNGGNSNDNGNKKKRPQEFFIGDDSGWGEGFTPQPFSNILRGHLYGKSGISPPDYGDYGLLSLSHRDGVIKGNENNIESDELMKNNNNNNNNNSNNVALFNSNSDIENNNVSRNFSHLGSITAKDVKSNKSLVHAYALPVTLKRIILSKEIANLCTSPGKTAIETAIDKFAASVTSFWSNDENDDDEILVPAPLEGPNIILDPNRDQNRDLDRAKNIPQWGFFSFQETSAMILSRGKSSFMTNGGLEQTQMERRESLDYEDEEGFKLLQDRSVSFNEEYNNGLKLNSHIQKGKNTSNNKREKVMKRNTISMRDLERERERDRDREAELCTSSYSLVSFIAPELSQPGTNTRTG